MPSEAPQEGILESLVETFDGLTGLFALPARPGSFESEEQLSAFGERPERPFEIGEEQSALKVQSDARHAAGRLQYTLTTEDREAVAVKGARDEFLGRGFAQARHSSDQVACRRARECDDENATSIDILIKQAGETSD
jgi:hypothetical protein